MPEVGEAVAFAIFDPLTAQCPFKVEGPDTPGKEPESPLKDDLEAAEEIQASNGGTLGENLEKGSPAGWGRSDTINPIFQPDSMEAKPRKDSKTNPALHVTVGGTQYGYIVAAHHLIPGEASLAKSYLYTNYMEAGGKFATPDGNMYTLKTNIGYNVNGNHNGVWLPGNYAIRKSKPHLNPTKETWKVLTGTNPNWCYAYMTACVEQVGGQFHDAHTKYNDAVLEILNKVCIKLALHQDACPECKSKTEVYPPYVLKVRLYLLSKYLRSKVRLQPGTWKIPWITSDKFKEELMAHGRIDPEHVTPPVIYLS